MALDSASPPNASDIHERSDGSGASGADDGACLYTEDAFKAHAHSVRRCASRWLRSPDLVDDVVLYAFEALFSRRTKHLAPRDVGGWLCVVAEHRALRVRRWMEMHEPQDVEEFDTADLSVADDTAEVLDRQLALSELGTAVMQLPERFRVVVQSRLSGQRVADAAHELSLSERTVKWRVSRAVQRLRAQLRSIEYAI